MKHGLLTPKRAAIAVDLDDVVVPFIEPLNKWHNRVYETDFKESDYISYFFSEIWGCSGDEALQRVKDFEEAPDFLDIKPYNDALPVLMQLRERGQIAVTSRGPHLEEFTRKQKARYLEGIFLALLHSTNHYSGTNGAGTKAEIAQRFGVKVALEDSVHYALGYTKIRVPVVLFDHPHNREDIYPELKGNRLIHRVYNWKQAGEKTFSLI